jgi:enamine deaminase RidA (YjgF/YER057c/UK114 family)
MADLKFLYHPTLDIARSITEIHPYLEYLAAVRCKRQCVLLVVNLLQSLFRSAVQFEFHYINVLVGLQHKVYPARAAVQVAALPKGAVVEIEAILVLD